MSISKEVVSGNLQGVVQFLLSGGDVHTINKNGDSLLHIAAAHGHLEIVRVLNKHGADMFASNDYAAIPIHIASLHGHTEIVQEFLMTNPSETYELVNAQDNFNDTPLKLAVGGGHFDTVVLLLAHAANVKLANKDAVTALHRAADGHLEIVRLLLDHSSDVNVVDNDGWSALHYACALGHCEIVLELLIRGADRSLKNTDGFTAAYLAQKYPHIQKVLEYHDSLEIKEPDCE